MAKPLKKPVKKVAKKVDHPIWLRFGSGDEFGEPRGYPTEPKAKQAIQKEVDDLVIWCRRHNTGGLKALADFGTAADQIVFHRDRQRLECLFDEHYGMRLVVEYWRE